jgi:hypothetical protein
MSKLGERLIKSAEEALAIARGERPGLRVAAKKAAGKEVHRVGSTKFVFRESHSGQFTQARKAKAAPAFKRVKKIAATKKH